MAVRSGLTARSGLMIIKHSSVRSVLVFQNCPTRTRIKLDIVFWLTVFRVQVEKTKQNLYSKVLWPWPCGFTPCCFGSSRCKVLHVLSNPIKPICLDYFSEILFVEYNICASSYIFFLKIVLVYFHIFFFNVLLVLLWLFGLWYILCFFRLI